ncbi:MAG: hypothetical protein ABI882_11800 [Acidobacteriota bacterium]
MNSDLPARIALAARGLARLEYRLNQVQAMVSATGSLFGRTDAIGARRHIRILRLRRDLAIADLELLKNELRLAVKDPSTVQKMSGDVA